MIAPLSDRTIASTTTNPNPILGAMSPPQIEGDKVVVTGWTCQKNLNEPMQAQLYMGGPAGVGQMMAATAVDLPSEPAINGACNTTDPSLRTTHRFKISILASKVLYRSLYVHALASGSS